MIAETLFTLRLSYLLSLRKNQSEIDTRQRLLHRPSLEQSLLMETGVGKAKSNGNIATP